MDLVIDIITACGTVVAAISIISAFVLYKLQKRDEHLAKVRESLQLLSNGINELDSMLNFELAHELSSSLVYSESSRYCIRRIYEIANIAIDNQQDESATQKSIRETLGVFGISFQETLANKYANLISSIKQASTIFYPDYKGLFRFSKACTTLMRNVFLNYKKVLLDEDLITKLIYQEMIKGHCKWESCEQFEKELTDRLISVIELSRIKHSQNDVDCLVKLLELVYSRHIELSAKEWRKLARANKKIQLLPYDSITTVTGDLREAEKCFRTIMDRDDSMNYSALVQTIEIANPTDD